MVPQPSWPRWGCLSYPEPAEAKSLPWGRGSPTPWWRKGDGGTRGTSRIKPLGSKRLVMSWLFWDILRYVHIFSVNPQDISCLTPRFEVDVGGQYSRVQTPLLQFWVFLRSTFNGESMWKIVNPMGFQWIFLETTPMIFTTPIIFQDISHGFPISIIGNTTTSWMAAGRKDRTSTGWRGDGAGTTKPYSCVGSQGSEGSTLVPW